MCEFTERDGSWQATYGPCVFGLWDRDTGTRLAISMEGHRTMRRITLLLFASLFLAISGSAQGPATDNKELQTLIDDVRAQQQRIADNQTKIDEKLAEVVEAIRVARIYAGRGK